MNLSLIKRIALKILVTGVDRDKPVYIVLLGDDKAQVQEAEAEGATEYRFYKKQYRNQKK